MGKVAVGNEEENAAVFVDGKECCHTLVLVGTTVFRRDAYVVDRVLGTGRLDLHQLAQVGCGFHVLKCGGGFKYIESNHSEGHPLPREGKLESEGFPSTLSRFPTLSPVV